MKKIFIKILKNRNPNFTLDNTITSRMLMQTIFYIVISLIRGLKVLILFRNPKFLMLGKSVKFKYIQNIKWGKINKFGNNITLSGFGKKGISFGNNFSLGSYSNIIVSTSLNNLGEYIKIGNNVGIGEYAYIGGAGGVEIGDSCIAGQYLSIHPENHIVENLELEIRFQGVTRKGIKIGENCWFGSKVTVLDGVHLGSGCVIAAGSVVNKSFPDNSIIGGVPAKLLKTRN